MGDDVCLAAVLDGEEVLFSTSLPFSLKVTVNFLPGFTLNGPTIAAVLHTPE